MTDDLPPKARPRAKPAKPLGPPKPAGLTPLPKQPKPVLPKRPPTPERQAAQRLGLSAESKAAAFLLAKGYRILARRFRTPVGEIDIVAGRRDTVVFVEVKARDTVDAAAEAVTPRQQSRIVDAAQYWLAAHPEAAAGPLRFDVVLVAPGRIPKHLQGAFDASR